MDWTAIIVWALAALGTGFGSLYGLKKSNDLIICRMNMLERKADIYNNAVERLYVAEKAIGLHEVKIKVDNHWINDLEKEKSSEN